VFLVAAETLPDILNFVKQKIYFCGKYTDNSAGMIIDKNHAALQKSAA
jgi:hypothetical protein